MANNTVDSCPVPFLNQKHFPRTGGDIGGSFCGQVSPTLTCCLPCPLEQWIYSDTLPLYVKVAQWLNIPALVCQVFLLVTFAVLPSERAKVQGRYLSVGLCIGLLLLQLAFIIPLGTKPSFCHDRITPNDMYTNSSCAWTGALLELGSMAGCIWILLRSLYTHLRVCWDIELTKRYVWIAHGLGWGLPALFLAVSLPITKLSYRLTSTCLPNPHASFVTWFGWLIAFALLASLIQFATTGFCLVIFMKSFFAHSKTTRHTRKGVGDPSMIRTRADSGDAAVSSFEQQPEELMSSNRAAWRRVKHVLALQWRSIVLSFLIIIDVVYSGIVYVLLTASEEKDARPDSTNAINDWSECLIEYSGDKNACLGLAKPLRLGEGQVVATLFMASLIGIFTFCLMVRSSMITGWWQLMRHPLRRPSVDFELVQPGTGTKHLSLTKPLASEQLAAEEAAKRVSLPELGNVSQRHATMTPLDFGMEDEEEKAKERKRKEELDDVL